MPVTIRKVRYESARAAALALGVSVKTVLGAVRVGRQDFVGLGVGKPMRCVIRGVEYATVRHAAQALGVQPCTIHSALRNGNPDRIGLGPDYRARRHNGGGQPPKPVTVCGQKFPSLAHLARAIGRDPHNLRASLRAGPTARANVALAVMRLIAARENAAMKSATADLQRAA